VSNKQQPLRRKHVPQRTCIACREVAGKRGLIRLVRTGDGRVQIDPTGKQAGRGAYLHPAQACWRLALENRQIERALRIKIDKEDRAALEAYMKGLPVLREETSQQEEGNDEAS
jgi:predicted RNA-binding protein YlxR (DUF448 family)